MDVNFPTCNDPRKCFAKQKDGGCAILSETYPEGEECPFRKLLMDEPEETNKELAAVL